MPLNQTTTPSAVIINTDIYTKYNSVVQLSSNNLDNSFIYPTMFDRWRDI